MEKIQAFIESLSNSDHKIAYEALKQLLLESYRSAEVYPFFDRFVAMLDDSNSYIRTRGIKLIAANAQWDRENKIEEIINRILGHMEDDKPITARACIQSLPTIAHSKPDLKEQIVTALLRTDGAKYPDSMRPLVRNDIQQALQKMQRQ